MRAKVALIARVRDSERESGYRLVTIRMEDGQRALIPDVTAYYLRFTLNGRRVVKPAGSNLDVAMLALTREQNLSAGQHEGYQALPGTSYIYFVQGAVTKRIKIGLAIDAERRLQALQAGSAEPLKVLGVMPGERFEEIQLHNRFASAHVHGEWFESHESLLQFIIEKTTPFLESYTKKSHEKYERLVIRLNPKLYLALRFEAASKNITISTWVTQAIEKTLDAVHPEAKAAA